MSIKIPLGSKGSGQSYSVIIIMKYQSSFRSLSHVLTRYVGVRLSYRAATLEQKAEINTVSTVSLSQSESPYRTASAQRSRAVFQRLLDVNVTTTLLFLFPLLPSSVRFDLQSERFWIFYRIPFSTFGSRYNTRYHPHGPINSIHSPQWTPHLQRC